MAVREIKAVWTGVTGLPGVNTWYWNAGGTIDDQVDAVHQFYADLAGYLPPGVSIQVAGTGNELVESTGALSAVWAASSTPSVVNGSGSNAFAAGVGACVTWHTSTVVNGRLVHGRTFLVPLMSGVYASDGTLTSTFMGDIATRISDLITAAAGDFKAWHRPVAGSGGSLATVLSGSCPDQATRLVTRRR